MKSIILQLPMYLAISNTGICVDHAEKFFVDMNGGYNGKLRIKSIYFET